MWSILTSKQSSSIMLFSLSSASCFIVLCGLYQVGCAVVTSYGKTLISTLRRSCRSVGNYVTLKMIFPVLRLVDDVRYGTAILNQVAISVIFVVLLVMALMARVYALVRR